ncbi:MAG: aldo/keto reductase [Desulfobulbaceae bacterium]|nr:aldo/keto reductase [Desulfobulbaceae bacterium]
MNTRSVCLTRRTFLLGSGVLAASLLLPPMEVLGQKSPLIQRAIPSSGEMLPVMGMGTWGTFDVGNDPAKKEQLVEVIQAFFDYGGRLIDSSPMYGRSESVLGELLRTTGNQKEVFAATKVWTDGRQSGIEQMRQSIERIGVDVMDLMQIHNLRDWRTHLPILRDWKEQGRFRYIGITTSHGRFHQDLEHILKTEPFDFVQFTYNLEDRVAEQRLLPLAADSGIATLINRPFQRGELFRKVKGATLPDWSEELGCRSWAQFFLKFIAAHPAVTCLIPATSKVHHMKDNMEAGFGRLPDQAMRRRMIAYYDSL